MKNRGTMAERIRASYDRLAEERPALARAVAKVKPCQLCDEPAWSDGLCMAHLIERGRAITDARVRARRLARRQQFFLAKRTARRAGDLELWSEIGWRQRVGSELPTDVSQTASWRSKWKKPQPPASSANAPHSGEDTSCKTSQPALASSALVSSSS